MIVTKTPLRISFVGGGSDLPSFYREESGAVVSASIDKYVYVTVSEKFDGTIRAAYSVTENVTTLDELQHDLIREALKASFVLDGGIEIHSIADIPSGTGLGSSSAFTVGLLAGLYTMNEIEWHGPQWLAHDACVVEIDRCGHPIGKQDQYAAAYGGINLLRFTADRVNVEPVSCDANLLSDHLLLLYTGISRAGDAGQQIAAQRQDRDKVRTLAGVAHPFADALANSDMEACGRHMHDAWLIKRHFTNGGWATHTTDTPIDQWYAQARLNGAWGGKLCGAGGGGFLAFLAPPDRHEAITQATGLRAVPVRLGVEGCRVVYSS